MTERHRGRELPSSSSSFNESSSEEETDDKQVVVMKAGIAVRVNRTICKTGDQAVPRSSVSMVNQSVSDENHKVITPNNNNDIAITEKGNSIKQIGKSETWTAADDSLRMKNSDKSSQVIAFVREAQSEILASNNDAKEISSSTMGRCGSGQNDSQSLAIPNPINEPLVEKTNAGGGNNVVAQILNKDSAKVQPSSKDPEEPATMSSNNPMLCEGKKDCPDTASPKDVNLRQKNVEAIALIEKRAEVSKPHQDVIIKSSGQEEIMIEIKKPQKQVKETIIEDSGPSSKQEGIGVAKTHQLPAKIPLLEGKAVEEPVRKKDDVNHELRSGVVEIAETKKATGTPIQPENKKSMEPLVQPENNQPMETSILRESKQLTGTQAQQDSNQQTVNSVQGEKKQLLEITMQRDDKQPTGPSLQQENKQPTGAPVQGENKQTTGTPVQGGNKEPMRTMVQQGEKQPTVPPIQQEKKQPTETPVQGENKQTTGAPVQGENKEPMRTTVRQGEKQPTVPPIQQEKKQPTETPVQGENKQTTGAPVQGENKEPMRTTVRQGEKQPTVPPIQQEKKQPTETPVQGENKQTTGAPVQGGNKEPMRTMVQQGEKQPTVPPIQQEKKQPTETPVQGENKQTTGAPVQGENKEPMRTTVRQGEKQPTVPPIQQEKKQPTETPVQGENKQTTGAPVQGENKEPMRTTVQQGEKQPTVPPIQHGNRQQTGTPMQGENKETTGTPVQGGNKEPVRTLAQRTSEQLTETPLHQEGKQPMGIPVQQGHNQLVRTSIQEGNKQSTETRVQQESKQSMGIPVKHDNKQPVGISVQGGSKQPMETPAQQESKQPMKTQVQPENEQPAETLVQQENKQQMETSSYQDKEQPKETLMQQENKQSMSASKEATAQNKFTGGVTSNEIFEAITDVIGRRVPLDIKLPQGTNAESTHPNGNIIQPIAATSRSSNAVIPIGKTLLNSHRDMAIASEAKTDIAIAVEQKQAEEAITSKRKASQAVIQTLNTVATNTVTEKIAAIAVPTGEITAEPQQHLIKSSEERSDERPQKAINRSIQPQKTSTNSRNTKALLSAQPKMKLETKKCVEPQRKKSEETMESTKISDPLKENRVRPNEQNAHELLDQKNTSEQLKTDTPLKMDEDISKGAIPYQKLQRQDDFPVVAHIAEKNDSVKSNNVHGKMETLPEAEAGGLRMKPEEINAVHGKIESLFEAGQRKGSEGIVEKGSRSATSEVLTNKVSLTISSDSTRDWNSNVSHLADERALWNEGNSTDENDDVFIADNEVKREHSLSEDDEFVDAISETASDHATFTLDEPGLPDDLSSLEGSPEDMLFDDSSINDAHCINTEVTDFEVPSKGERNIAAIQNCPPKMDDVDLLKEADAIEGRSDAPMEISFADDHPTDPNGTHEEVSRSRPEMDVNVKDSSQEPMPKLEPVQQSLHPAQLVIEETTSKEVTGPNLLKAVEENVCATPMKETTVHSIDSRTVTRPPKKGQVLPEVVATPVFKVDHTGEAEYMDAVATENKQQREQPVAATVHPTVPVVPAAPAEVTPVQVLTAHPSQAPKVQPQPPQAVVSPATRKAQPQAPSQVVVSSAKATTAVVSDANVVKPSEQAKRDEQTTGQRVRQRTVTLHNQLSAEIAAAFKEIRQMDVEDPMMEAQRRIQAHMVAKEKEWAAKLEKLSQILAHEQKKNDSLEQKATERLMLLGEHELVIRKLVEELKQQGRKGGKGMPDSTESFGRPGPERTLSPDDVALLMKERDQLAEEVNSLESSYSDLFRRYEKLRQTSISIKDNEEKAKKQSAEMGRRYALLADKLELLRRNAEEQLDLANNEIERMIKQHETDTLALRLKLKQLESKNETLVVSVEAKQREIDEMTALFEEVINKAEDNS